MKASIIIPTKNGGTRYQRVLQAIFENTLDGGFEVIVIDSGSTDETLRISRSFPVRLYEIRPQDFGHGRVRNQGASLAQGEYLVFLSQDSIPASSDWLSLLLQAFAADPAIAGVFSRQVSDGRNPMEAFFLQHLYDDRPVVRALGLDQQAAPSLKDIFFSNVGSAIRKDVWQQFPFNETILMSEDQEWSKRVLLAGYKTAYVPGARVYHAHDYTTATVYRRNYASGLSLHGITRETFWSSVRSSLAYLTAETGYILRNHGLTKLAGMFLYEIARYAGFATGAVVGSLGKRNHPCRTKQNSADR